MQGKCEVLEKGLCTGCEGCMYNLDILKNKCETYQEYQRRKLKKYGRRNI